MSTETRFQPSEVYRHPNQPTFVYDIHRPWEDIVAEPPIWLGKFPPKPTEKKYTLFGQPTISPLIIAAGPASGHLWTDYYLKMGYGGVFEKTRRTTERRSNPLHNIAIVKSDVPITDDNIDEPRLGSLNPEDWERYHSMTNSFGNPSSRISTWTEEFRRQMTAVEDGQVLAISVTATVDPDKKDNFDWDFLRSDPESHPQYDDLAEFFWKAAVKHHEHQQYELRNMAKLSDEEVSRRKTNFLRSFHKDLDAMQYHRLIADVLVGIAGAVGAGAKAVEVNYACPNVLDNALEGEMFQDGTLVWRTFEEAKKLFPDTKLGLKVGRFTSKKQARRVIFGSAMYMDFISTINALSVPIVDDDGDPILVGRERAGTCGEILRDISLRQTEMIAELREEGNYKFEIHAGGGIYLPEHVEQYRNAGGDGFFSGSDVLANPLLNNDYFYWLQENS